MSTGGLVPGTGGPHDDHIRWPQLRDHHQYGPIEHPLVKPQPDDQVRVTLGSLNGMQIPDVTLGDTHLRSCNRCLAIVVTGPCDCTPDQRRRALHEAFGQRADTAQGWGEGAKPTKRHTAGEGPPKCGGFKYFREGS